MALQRRSTSNALSLTVPIPAGTLTDEKIVVDIFLDVSGGVISAPAGAWVKEEEVIVTGANSYQHAIFTLITGGSEPTEYIFTASGSNPNSQATTYFDDVGGGSFVASPTAQTSIVDNGTTSTSVTSAVDVLDGDILHCAWTDDNGNTVGTPPGTMTINLTTIDGSNGNTVSTFREDITADALGVTRTLVWAGTADQTTAGAVVLRYTPAAGGAGSLLSMNDSMANLGGLRQ